MPHKLRAYLHTVRSAFSATYIEPWKNMRRLITYLASMAGTAGYTCIVTASPFDYATQGHEQLLTFLLAMSFGMSPLTSPMVYFSVAVMDSRKLRLILAGVSIAVFVVLLKFNEYPIITGLATGAFSSFYIAAFNIAMFRNTSEKKRGFQVVLANVLSILAGAGAGLAAGWWANAYGETITIMFVGAIAMILSMIGSLSVCQISPPIRPREFWREIVNIVIKSPREITNWANLSIGNAATLVLPALLFMLGYSALYVGYVFAIRIVVTAILAPWMGKLISHKNGNDFLVGSGLYAACWLLLLVDFSNFYILSIFILVERISLSLMFMAAEVLVYDRKSYASQATYGLFLGHFRLLGLLIFVPLLFISPQVYIAALAVTLTVVFALQFAFRRRAVATTASVATE